MLHKRLAALELREVHSLDVGIPLLDVVQPPVLVDHDHAAGLVHQSEVRTHLADGTRAPDGDDVALVDNRVDDAVPARAEHVRQVQSLLVGDIVGELEEVVVAVWHARVLGLAASEAACEVGVAEHAGGAAAVHAVFDRVAVCPLCCCACQHNMP